MYDLGDLTDYEKAGLELLKPELRASIDKARPPVACCPTHALASGTPNKALRHCMRALASGSCRASFLIAAARTPPRAR